MAEILVEYPAVVQSSNGDEHEVRAYGRERDDERWEAWLEFEPLHGGVTIRTRAETTQPDLEALLAWAHGISRVYLEGAIQRAIPSGAVGGPADPPTQRSRSTAEPEGVLDPFEVYGHGQSLLRRHLEGLSVSHLRHIARAYDMFAEADVELTKDELINLIVLETARRAPLEVARTT